MSADQTPGRPTEQEWIEWVFGAAYSQGVEDFTTSDALAIALHLAPLIDRVEAAARAEALDEASVHLTRDHTMPPNKDHRNYDYRMGWWDAMNKAGSILDRRAREAQQDGGDANA